MNIIASIHVMKLIHDNGFINSFFFFVDNTRHKDGKIYGGKLESRF